MHIQEPIRLLPASQMFERDLAELRRTSGIYVLYGGDGAAVHLGRSRDLERRLRRLLLSTHRGALLAERLAHVDCWPTGSQLEELLLLYTIARQLYPREYQKILKLRLPWFVALTNEAFPRLETTNRLRGRYEKLWGPFRARAAAEQYEQQVLGLFQMRRCTETLVPDPAHPGCIYGEMNQCLRPCQQAASAEEYAAESARVRDFLASNGRSATAILIGARDRASEAADFEQAAQIHKRIERLKSAAEWREPVIEEVERFHGVALTRSAAANEIVLWPMLAGYWQEPVRVELKEERADARSLDSTIRELLAAHLAHARAEGNRAEELALFARWFYSSWRDGEWFPFAMLSNPNYRKLIREVSKLRHNSCPSTKK